MLALPLPNGLLTLPFDCPPGIFLVFVGGLYLALVLALIAGISRMMHGPIATLRRFCLAHENLGVLPVACAFVASWFGAASTLATMDAVNQQGLGGLWALVVPSCLSCLLIGSVMAKKAHLASKRLGVLSLAEAMAATYGPQGQWWVALTMVLTSIAFMASQLLAVGQLGHAVFGLPVWQIMAGVATLIVGYALAGGFLAVIITDFIQLGAVWLGLLLLCGLLLLGFQWPGLGGVWSHAQHTLTVLPGWLMQHRQPTFWQFWDGWSHHWGSVVTFVLAWSIAPEMWQRMSAARNADVAQRGTLWASAGLLLLFTLVGTIGVLSAPWVASLAPGQHVLTQLALGPVVGLDAYWGPLLAMAIVLGAGCAMASTTDSSLNVSATVLANDVLAGGLQHIRSKVGLTDTQRLLLARMATALLPIPAIVVASRFENILNVLWLSADLYASVMVVPVWAMLFASPSVGASAAKVKGFQHAGHMAMAIGLIMALISACRTLGVFSESAFWHVWPPSPYATLLAILASGLGFFLVKLQHRLRHRGQAL